MPGPACAHPRQHRLDHADRTEDVGFEHLPDLREAGFLDRADHPEAGIVDQDVDAAMPCLDARHRRFDR